MWVSYSRMLRKRIRPTYSYVLVPTLFFRDEGIESENENGKMKNKTRCSLHSNKNRRIFISVSISYDISSFLL